MIINNPRRNVPWHVPPTIIFIFLLITTFGFAKSSDNIAVISDAKEIIPYQESYVEILAEKMFWMTHHDSDPKFDINLPVPLYRQQRPLSCECAAASVVAQFHGFSFFNEDQCVQGIEVYEGSLQNGIWGDPDKKFIGNIFGSQRNLSGWGVYALPIEKILKKHHIPAKAKYNASVENITREIVKGHPVVVWVTTGLGRCHQISWQTPQGKAINTCVNEHAVVVHGFKGSLENPEAIRIMDVYTKSYKEYSLWQFKQAWGYFGNMMLEM